MGAVWITFATENNVDGDVDYVAQEIDRSGLRTRLHPLFPDEDDKIDRLMPAFLTRPDQSDAWIFYGSDEALQQDRLERIRRVVDRASLERGPFPRVGLFTSTLTMAKAEELQFTERMFLDETDWRSRLGAALQTNLEAVAGNESGLPSYVTKLYPISREPYQYAFEFRPKIGRWEPALFAILPEERATVDPHIEEHAYEEGFSEDGEWYFQVGQAPATPQASYKILMKQLPSRLAFGQEGMDSVVILTVRSSS